MFALKNQTKVVFFIIIYTIKARFNTTTAQYEMAASTQPKKTEYILLPLLQKELLLQSQIQMRQTGFRNGKKKIYTKGV